MFTGIIKKVSSIENLSKREGSFFVSIKIPKSWKLTLGQSIAVNGVCSTVNKISKKDFIVEYMPETIKKTTVGNYTKGTLVNLEPCMKLNDLLDGHIVQGHVDTKGKIIEVKDVQKSKILKIKIPTGFMKFIANKGSVTIDGISLTVVDTGKDWFTVSLVSFTLENTNLGNIKKGDEVNIETDVLAKYIDKLMKK